MHDANKILELLKNIKNARNEMLETRRILKTNGVSIPADINRSISNSDKTLEETIKKHIPDISSSVKGGVEAILDIAIKKYNKEKEASNSTNEHQDVETVQGNSNTNGYMIKIMKECKAIKEDLVEHCRVLKLEGSENYIIYKKLSSNLNALRKEIKALEAVVKDNNGYSMHNSDIWFDFISNSKGYIKTIEEIYNADFECGIYGETILTNKAIVNLNDEQLKLLVQLKEQYLGTEIDIKIKKEYYKKLVKSFDDESYKGKSITDIIFADVKVIFTDVKVYEVNCGGEKNNRIIRVDNTNDYILYHSLYGLTWDLSLPILEGIYNAVKWKERRTNKHSYFVTNVEHVFTEPKEEIFENLTGTKIKPERRLEIEKMIQEYGNRNEILYSQFLDEPFTMTGSGEIISRKQIMLMYVARNMQQIAQLQQNQGNGKVQMSTGKNSKREKKSELHGENYFCIGDDINKCVSYEREVDMGSGRVAMCMYYVFYKNPNEIDDIRSTSSKIMEALNDKIELEFKQIDEFPSSQQGKMKKIIGTDGAVTDLKSYLSTKIKVNSGGKTVEKTYKELLDEKK